MALFVLSLIVLFLVWFAVLFIQLNRDLDYDIELEDRHVEVDDTRYVLDGSFDSLKVAIDSLCHHYGQEEDVTPNTPKSSKTPDEELSQYDDVLDDAMYIVNRVEGTDQSETDKMRELMWIADTQQEDDFASYRVMQQVSDLAHASYLINLSNKA